ncbi:hypothetical protein IQ279_27330, partial [Streptomyces verrucosisporus]|nr:hypothetical protein [Streptomyces verrucosisporus]
EKAQWLDAALSARDGYRTALDDLLRTVPPLQQSARPARFTQQTVSTTLPADSASPTPEGLGEVRSRRR